VNTASREELLRVPGLGKVTVDRILEARRERTICGSGALQTLGARALRARDFLTFNGTFSPSPQRRQLVLGL